MTFLVEAAFRTPNAISPDNIMIEIDDSDLLRFVNFPSWLNNDTRWR